MPAIVLTTTDIDISRRKKILTVKGVLSGAYVNGTPIVLNLTTVTNPKFLSSGAIGANPTRGRILNQPDGYTGRLIPGSTLQTWGLTIFDAAGVELPSEAIPAGLLADPFFFEFEGNLGNF